MTPPKRVDLAGAAALLNVPPRTVQRYVSRGDKNGAGVAFPKPEGGLWLESALKAWNKGRVGLGGKGVPKSREGTACERCGNVVERRIRDKETGAMQCKGCDLKAGEAQQ